MKLALPLASLLVFSTAIYSQTADAQSRTSRPSRGPVYEYCTSERFQNYVRLASAMRDYVTPMEYSSVYLPLKVKATKAEITLKNYGPLSAKTHKAVYEIVAFVDGNQTKFDTLWEVEAFYDVARDLMEMTQALSRDLE